jgi:hypothetical protein
MADFAVVCFRMIFRGRRPPLPSQAVCRPQWEGSPRCFRDAFCKSHTKRIHWYRMQKPNTCGSEATLGWTAVCCRTASKRLLNTRDRAAICASMLRQGKATHVVHIKLA